MIDEIASEEGLPSDLLSENKIFMETGLDKIFSSDTDDPMFENNDEDVKIISVNKHRYDKISISDDSLIN